MTSACTPFVRQVPRDGKRQATTYFCCEKCFCESYKHIGFFDGKAEERRAQREAGRDRREYRKQYYAEHAEEERRKARERYWADPVAAAAANSYNRKKRRLLETT